MGELLPLLIALLGGIFAGFWPGWTARGAYAAWCGVRESYRLAGEADHDAAWEAEFSAAPTVAGGDSCVLEALAREHPPPAYRAHVHQPNPVVPCWCGWPWRYAAPPLAALPAPAPPGGRHCPQCADTYADLAGHLASGTCRGEERSERSATIPEIAEAAEYQLTWGEVYGLMYSADEWYDRTFETGQFKRIDP